MSTAGPNLPTTVTGTTNAIGGGTLAWTNPTNIKLADGSKATRVFTRGIGTSDDLIGTGFGFLIPAGATIRGIQLDVDEGSTAGLIVSSVIKLLKAGAAVGSNKAGVPAAGTEWSSTPGNVTYGGAADLWGTTWTPSDVNASNFGAVVVAAGDQGNTLGDTDSASTDYFKITVTYTVDANVNVTGVSATGSIGTATFSGTAAFSPTGLSSTASLGTATFTGTAVKAVTGVSATGSLGTAFPTISVPVTGVSATAALGTATFSGTATFAVTGLSSTASLGTATFTGTANFNTTGLSATASLGTATFTGTANFNTTGLSATASLGQIRIDAVVSVTGVHATGVLGQIIGVLSANVVGVVASAFVGSVAVEVRNRLPVVVWIN